MEFPSRSKLEQSSEASRFLVLRWQELFAKYTPDTYRPHLMDAPGLLEELRWVSELAAEDGRWDRQRRLVVEELKHCMERDSLVGELSPRIQYALKDLKVDTKPGECEAIARLGCEELQDYGDFAFSRLEQLLDKESGNGKLKSKQKADRLLGRIATRAVQRGFGRRYCEQLLSESDLQKEPFDVLDQLQEGLNGSECTWRCIYALKCARSDRHIIEKLLDEGEFDVLEGKETPSGGQAWTQFQKKTDSSHYASLEVTAADPQDAVHKGLVQLNRLVDLVNFYYSAAPIRIERKIYADHGREQFLDELDATSISGLRPQRNATERALDLYDTIDWEEVPRELVRTLEQRAAAYTATDVRVRFVNLWSAMETLTSPRPESSVHDRVVSAVMPLVTAHRPRKILRYAAILLHEMGVISKLKHESEYLVHSDKSSVDPAELLFILSRGAPGESDNDPADEDRVSVDAILKELLLPATEYHPVVCNRLFRLWKEFHEPANLRSKLETSAKRVSWQLERIYRARNLLVHTGRRLGYLPYLLKNLEYYFSTVLGRVLHDLTDNEDWTVMDALQSRKMEWVFLRDALDASPDIVTASHLNLETSSNLMEQPVWGDAAGSGSAD